MKDTSPRHYSYTVYADPETARTFDGRRFGGPIGEVVAAAQAAVLIEFAGDVRGRRVLDIGTGTGRAALLLAERGAEVTGIDASEEMLAVARQRSAERGLAVTFCRGDGHRLELPDRAFELAVALRVLMHTPDWRTALSEWCRVADRALILDYPSACSLAALQSMARRVVYACGLSTEPYRVFTMHQIVDALAAGGFRLRASHRQFVLPIALHKAIGSPALTRGVERVLSRIGMTALFGSPVTLIAERCASS